MRCLLRATFLILVLSIGVVPLSAKAVLPGEVRNDREFMSWLTDLTDQAGEDEHYQRIPLDTEPQAEEFTVVLHRLFRGRMTDAAFADWVAARYPGHGYETATILRILHTHRKLHGN